MFGREYYIHGAMRESDSIERSRVVAQVTQERVGQVHERGLQENSRRSASSQTKVPGAHQRHHSLCERVRAVDARGMPCRKRLVVAATVEILFEQEWARRDTHGRCRVQLHVRVSGQCREARAHAAHGQVLFDANARHAYGLRW